MTTTGTYQGLQGDRNTSRVLRPPGGGSSDIFGTNAAEPVAAPVRGTAPPSNNIFGPIETKEEPPKNRENTGNKLFGEPSDEQSPSKRKEDDLEEAEAEPEEAQTAQTSPKEDGPSPAQSAQTYAKRMQQADVALHEVNPITGIAYKSPTDAQDGDGEGVNIQGKGTGNPITGEANDHTPAVVTRVRQPPGGASSKLW